MKIIGIILIVTGIFALVYTGFTFNTEEKVVNIGSVEITKDKRHSLNWPPIAGVILVVSGMALVWVGKMKSLPANGRLASQ